MVGGIGLVGVPGERVLREDKGSDSAIQSTTETVDVLCLGLSARPAMITHPPELAILNKKNIATLP